MMLTGYAISYLPEEAELIKRHCIVKSFESIRRIVNCDTGT